MPFTPTKEYMGITPGEPCDPAALFSKLDPDVNWLIADPTNDDVTLTGVYVSTSPSKFRLHEFD